METVANLALFCFRVALGVGASLVVFSLLFPVLWKLPQTLLLVVSKKLKITALISLFVGFLFPLVILFVGYFLIGLATPAWKFVTSAGFIIGVIWVPVIFLFTGGFNPNRFGLKEDYAEFVLKHHRAPSGVEKEHLAFAAAVKGWWQAPSGDPEGEQWSAMMYLLAESFDVTVDHEKSIRDAFQFLGTQPEEIAVAIDIYQSRRALLQDQIDHAEQDRIDQKEQEEQDRIDQEESLSFDQMLAEFSLKDAEDDVR